MISARRKDGGRGGAAAGASAGGRGPAPTRPPGPLAPRRPIAKFNAKVMRERVRLRAAMQERPATRTDRRQYLDDDAAHRIAELPSHPNYLHQPQAPSTLLVLPNTAEYVQSGSCRGQWYYAGEHHVHCSDARDRLPVMQYLTEYKKTTGKP